jgi:hypothetical protein
MLWCFSGDSRHCNPCETPSRTEDDQTKAQYICNNDSPTPYHLFHPVSSPSFGGSQKYLSTPTRNLTNQILLVILWANIPV